MLLGALELGGESLVLSGVLRGGVADGIVGGGGAASEDLHCLMLLVVVVKVMSGGACGCCCCCCTLDDYCGLGRPAVVRLGRLLLLLERNNH